MIRSALTLLFFLPACSLNPLPTEPPPLRDMEEPMALKIEPDDEAERVQLAPGSFSGIYVKPAWFEEPDEPGQAPDALAIERIVENSPAVVSGLRVGDLLLSVRVGNSPRHDLTWPAHWRKIETETSTGTVLEIRYDRANVEHTTRLTLAPRVSPAERTTSETFRETSHAGIVVRTATEVEARRAGLGTGGGAVLIGMAANSPWRAAGLRFGDIVVAVQGTSLDHPQALLGAIRTTPTDAALSIEYMRGDRRNTVSIPMTTRESGITSFSIPLLFSMSSRRGVTQTSILFGLIGYESTPAAWEFCLFWFLCVRGGDGDVLREVKR